MNLKRRLLITSIIGSIIILIAGLFVSYNVTAANLNVEDTISGLAVQKNIIKPYSYVAAGYERIKLFPIDSYVFNSSPDYFCAEHGTAYAKAGRNTVLGGSYHKSYTITKHRIPSGYTDDPKGDIDASADVYLDENGNPVINPKEYYGYRNVTESPANTVYTNWVYNLVDVQLSCENNVHGRPNIDGVQDGGMAFLLACYKQTPAERLATGYHSDPLQFAVWDWLGQLGIVAGESNPYRSAAVGYQKYHVASATPNVDTTPDSNVGTTKSGSTYTVGPFTMSNYVRAKDYGYEINGSFSGIVDDDTMGDLDEEENWTIDINSGLVDLQNAFDTQGDFKGTIIKAEAVVTNEAGATKRIEFPVPEPGAVYNIDLSEAAIDGYDELLDVVFTYQRIHATGSGTFYYGEQQAVSFNEESSQQSGCTYYCQDGTGSGNDHFKKSPGSSSTPYSGSCTHTWYTGCYYTCPGHKETWTNPDGTTGSRSWHCDGCVHHYGTKHTYTHSGDPFLCTHGHEDCKYFKWSQPSVGGDYAQDGFAGAGVLSTEQIEYSVRVSVPLKTKMAIYKYISKVDHVGESVNLHNLGTSRREMSMQDKFNNTVKVERGDEVTYTIELINDSRFPTRVKVKDTLPNDCTFTQYPDEIRNSAWITVDAKNKKTFTVKVRPTKDNGKDTNTIEFITKNDTDPHMQNPFWDNNATHGGHTNGSIVNTYTKEKDSDTYEIKEYNVNIEKYIYDVEHNKDNLGISNIDTTLNAGNSRSIRSGMAEETKRTNPVYAEYGDTVTYKIIVYNTTSDYNSGINNSAAPYWKPDKVYVDIQDKLPKKYSNLKIDVDGVMVSGNQSHTISKVDSSTNGGTFTIRNLMVPANGKRVVTVTLTVDEYTKGTIEENNVKFIDQIRNINRGPNKTTNVNDKYDVIKNNPLTTNTSDFYKLNNYNTFIDKYIYKYDEKVQKENNNNIYTNNGLITNADGTLKTPRINNNTKTSTISDGNVNDTVREPNGKDTYKEQHPVSAEKYETLVYGIKVSNEATNVNKNVPSGNKPATQVRTTKVTDKMQVGLTQKSVTAVMYNKDGSVCTRYSSDGSVKVNVSGGTLITENGVNYNKYEYTIGNETILNPGEYIVYYVTVQITESNMYLHSLKNTAEVTILTNINNTNNNNREVQNPKHNENIAKQQSSSDFVRMKDLVIAGQVWLDINRDGYMNESQTTDQQKEYYNINDSAMKKDIVVHLYKSDGTLLRTTKTDENGLYTFGRDENLAWYDTYNHDTGFSKDKMYQRVDKADNKDENGNYTSGSKYLSYYVEYEYDGVLYKSTEFYAGSNGMANLSSNNDGTYDPKYLIDSNAAEFVDVREEFNKKYEYISYDVAYNTNLDKTNDLVFDKTGHTSQLMEDNSRLMTSRSFINTPSNKNDANSTNYLWLYPFDNSKNNEIPETDYLKHINLGLELREDVDIALTKDIYKVKTTIDGEEMEYDYNQNNGLNGDMGSSTTNKYLNDYIIKEPYGLELYESDYKYRVDQYLSQAVKEYKGIRGESELNVEVTYRMTIDNKAVTDDDTIPGSTDTKLDVKVHEILDLYDENFIKFVEDTTKDVLTIKTKDADGFLVDKQIKIAEAWFFKKASDVTATDKVLDGKYSITNANDVANGAKPIYAEDDAGEYVKVELTLSNTSSRGAKGKFSEKDNNFTKDGYNTLYITGMGNEVIHEGEDLDIYVKYVLDKDKLEVDITNENFEETKNTNITDSSIEIISETKALLERSLKLAERTVTEFKEKFGRGTENIAQVDAYSVWYTDGKPASIVDMDSNAGNIGIKNDSQGASPKNPNYKESSTSADDIDYYEDTAYKTGIEISAKGTENTKITQNTELLRKILGTVWDDSRTDTLGTGGETQYIGDGLYNEKIKDNAGKENENVELNYKDSNVTEEKDISVRNARAEFIEVVQTDKDHYYEQTLQNVTWKQVQHIRTDTDGKYELQGFVPGKYVVRFTYGDTVEANAANLDNYDSTLEAQADMLIFNGQDYKSTKYTTNLSDDETDVDEIIRQLEVATKSDARDDEIRRLEVNRFSEVMTNEIAEILKGTANGTDLTKRSDANSKEQLRTLTENTYMNAETVEFLVKAEKLTEEQTERYIVKSNVNVNGIVDRVKDIYYKELENIQYVDTGARDFNIENVDFGIEYRPESEISLIKEINEMKITTEDGETLVDLKFYTEGEGDNITHHIDTENSIGMELVQFISNDYTTQALVSKLTTEKLQGFIYIQVDDDILQGSKIEITYKFKAENDSEIDRITKNLNAIRYKENKATQDLVAVYGNGIIDTNYTASGTGRNIVYSDTYAKDQYSDIYRNKRKTLTTDGKTGYFGKYVGYGYYTGNDSDLDMISSLKFDKILDYVDTDLEFEQETNTSNLLDRSWTRTTASELLNYVYSLREYRNPSAPIGSSVANISDSELKNRQGIEYSSLVLSVDDRTVDIGDPNEKDANGNNIKKVNNNDLSRFLIPHSTDTSVNSTDSIGIVYLPVSKVISAETSTDNMSYENIAEIVQFTTLTGRRTNFATTIGNADIQTTKEEPGKGSIEFVTASLEPDTAATETVTLTPPTGLMKNRRAIVNTVETTKTGLQIIAIVAAVVVIGIVGTKVTIKKIKKRRIK